MFDSMKHKAWAGDAAQNHDISTGIMLEAEVAGIPASSQTNQYKRLALFHAWLPGILNCLCAVTR